MTIGIHLMKALLIQAVGLAFQAATATPVVSSAMTSPIHSTEPGGLLQNTIPTHGSVFCTTTSTMSADSATIEATAFLLVASWIKNFKL